MKLRNNSAAAITFSLVITPSLITLQQSSVLTVSPSSEITLEPNGGSCNVHVMFTPTSRIAQFTEEVFHKLCFLIEIFIWIEVPGIKNFKR